jgi:L-asparaginase II
MGAAPFARVVRSGLEESVLMGHVAVCDPRGRLLARAGDADRVVFLRSCTKPFQAAVALSVIGDETIPEREVAVMCASHNGEPVHLGAVRALLDRGGLGPDVLRTPPGYPLDPEERARSQHPNRLFHNCSGKHAGMVLACVGAGWDLATYPARSHPLQRRIRTAVQRASSVGRLSIGVDGCGVPVHGMALRHAATMFAQLASPEGLEALAPHAQRATDAMRTEPYLVGGRRRLDTDTMQAVDALVVKEGAEGLVCAADLHRGIGIAVKTADGGSRGTGPALLETLRQLDLVGAAQLRSLATHHRPGVSGGEAMVGVVEPLLELRRR